MKEKPDRKQKRRKALNSEEEAISGQAAGNAMGDKKGSKRAWKQTEKRRKIPNAREPNGIARNSNRGWQTKGASKRKGDD